MEIMRRTNQILNHKKTKNHETAYAMRHVSVSTTVHYLSFKEEEVDASIVGI